MLSMKFLHILWCHSTYSELRHHTMGQVLAYKRLKTIENYKTVRLISSRGHLLEVFVYKRFWSRDLTGKNLVFWIDGCFMGGGRLRDKWWWHTEVQPYGEFAERSRHFFFLSSHVLMMSMFDRMWAVVLQPNPYYMAPLSKGKSGHRTLVTGSLIAAHSLLNPAID